ncbi:MAG: hypothetical protein PGN37_01220 [Mycobacterium kyogaense]|uniref:hypothetical protein n=1 Tax=Mycobacterium kyogaense TaxID=2212479 RepID=UPI002FF7B592
MNTDIRAREGALLSGRWGEANEIRSAAMPWFTSANVPETNVRAADVHPLIHNAASMSDGDGNLQSPTSFEWDAALALRRTPHTAKRRPGPSEADRELCEVINGRLSPRTIIELDEAQEVVLDQALALLDETIPSLAADAFEYLHLFVLTDRTDMIGETWMEYPGLVLFGPAAFATPKVLAESIFHEALHSKTVWIERGMPNLKAGESEDDNEDDKPIAIPWRHEKDGSVTHWSAVRTYDAFYVYSHLTVQSCAVWERDRLEGDLDQFRRICFRAAYLSNQLRNNPDCAGIGAERHQLVSWLDSIRIQPFDLTEAGQRQLSLVA